MEWTLVESHDVNFRGNMDSPFIREDFIIFWNSRLNTICKLDRHTSEITTVLTPTGKIQEFVVTAEGFGVATDEEVRIIVGNKGYFGYRVHLSDITGETWTDSTSWTKTVPSGMPNKYFIDGVCYDTDNIWNNKTITYSIGTANGTTFLGSVYIDGEEYELDPREVKGPEYTANYALEYLFTENNYPVIVVGDWLAVFYRWRVRLGDVTYEEHEVAKWLNLRDLYNGKGCVYHSTRPNIKEFVDGESYGAILETNTDSDLASEWYIYSYFDGEFSRALIPDCEGSFSLQSFDNKTYYNIETTYTSDYNYLTQIRIYTIKITSNFSNIYLDEQQAVGFYLNGERIKEIWLNGKQAYFVN